jgi:ATP adenylyltransferase
MEYLEGDERERGCFLCVAGSAAPEDAAAGSASGEGAATNHSTSAARNSTLVVWRGESVYALLNAYPYTSGHVMVAPYAHVADLDALDSAVADELMQGVRLMIRALRVTYDPQGFNVGANLGAAGGAGYGEHLHFHVVPRWTGDTNFMTTTADTRVVPEALHDTARRLRAAVDDMTANNGSRNKETR